LRARAAAGDDLDAIRRQIADLQRLRDEQVEQRVEAVRRARREVESGAGGPGGSPLPPGRV
jgi:plasmid stabilization system protein ParE